MKTQVQVLSGYSSTCTQWILKYKYSVDTQVQVPVDTQVQVLSEYSSYLSIHLVLVLEVQVLSEYSNTSTSEYSSSNTP